MSEDYKEEYEESKFKEIGQKIARLFGFGYPSRLLLLYDREGNERKLEDPFIEDQVRNELPVLKREEIPTNPKKIPSKIRKKKEQLDKFEEKIEDIRDEINYIQFEKDQLVKNNEEPEEIEEKEDKIEELEEQLEKEKKKHKRTWEKYRELKTSNDEKNFENTLVRSSDSGRSVLLRGSPEWDMESALKHYSESIFVLILPFSIMYTWILLWSFGIAGMGNFGLVVNTGLLLTMIYQGYAVLSPGIQVIKASYKGQIEGLEFFVPQDPKYLKLEPTNEKQLESETVNNLLTWIRPIIAKNSHLTEELNNLFDEINKAYYQGMRDRSHQEDTDLNKWILAIIFFIAGVFLGFLLSGSVAPAPPSSGGSSSGGPGVILTLITHLGG